MKVLIEADGNVNQHSNKNQTPLNVASTQGHTEIIRLLLQQPNIDLNLNKIDDWNTTALGIATQNNHIDAIQLLTHLTHATKIKNYTLFYTLDTASILHILKSQQIL